jgi:hypothetical protein
MTPTGLPSRWFANDRHLHAESGHGLDVSQGVGTVCDGRRWHAEVAIEVERPGAVFRKDDQTVGRLDRIAERVIRPPATRVRRIAVPDDGRVGFDEEADRAARTHRARKRPGAIEDDTPQRTRAVPPTVPLVNDVELLAGPHLANSPTPEIAAATKRSVRHTGRAGGAPDRRVDDVRDRGRPAPRG